MGLVNESGLRQSPCAAEAIKEGYLYYINSGDSYRMTKITTVAQVVSGIAEDSSTDALGAARTLTAGDKHSFYRPGCGKVVKVASVISATYHRDAAVYGGQSADADGMCNTDNTNSAQKIGHYAGTENLTTTVSGQLIDVYLDVPIGGA